MRSASWHSRGKAANEAKERAINKFQFLGRISRFRPSTASRQKGGTRNRNGDRGTYIQLPRCGLYITSRESPRTERCGDEQGDSLFSWR